MATYNYAGISTDDLLLEVRSRKEKGSKTFDSLSDSPSKADMITALQADDAAMTAAKTTPEGAVSIPDAPALSFVHASCPPPPTDDKYTISAKKQSDGLDYAVAIHEPDSYGKTVSAKNKTYFWQGTEAEFRLQFDKQPGTVAGKALDPEPVNIEPKSEDKQD